MRKKFWAVCWGSVCRWRQATIEVDAATMAFGFVDMDRMTIRMFPSNPKYLALKVRNAFLADLFKDHKKKTGREIQ